MSDAEKESPSMPAVAPAMVEAGGAVAGAAVGLVLGGPAGALIGAGTGPLAAFGARHFSALLRRYFGALTAGLHDRDLGESEFLSLIEASESKVIALAALISSVQQAYDSRQIDLLANITLSLLDTDDRMAKAMRELISIAVSITPLQLDVLRFIEDVGITNPVTPDEIIDNFSLEMPLLRAVVRNLEHCGLIVDESRLQPHQAGVFWRVTDLGKWIRRVWTGAD